MADNYDKYEDEDVDNALDNYIKVAKKCNASLRYFVKGEEEFDDIKVIEKEFGNQEAEVIGFGGSKYRIIPYLRPDGTIAVDIIQKF
jgi:hypothetical protein